MFTLTTVTNGHTVAFIWTGKQARLRVSNATMSVNDVKAVELGLSLLPYEFWPPFMKPMVEKYYAGNTNNVSQDTLFN